MSFIKSIFVISILDLVLAKSILTNWNLSASAIDLFLNEPYYEKYIFNETKNGKTIKIKKVIEREKDSNQIKNGTKMIFESIELTVNDFENLQNFYYLNGKYYLCPYEKSIYVTNYTNNYTELDSLLEVVVYTPDNNGRQLKCYYINGDNRLFFLSFFKQRKWFYFL